MTAPWAPSPDWLHAASTLLAPGDRAVVERLDGLAALLAQRATTASSSDSLGIGGDTDEAIAEWWIDSPWARSLIWSVTAHGATAGIEVLAALVAAARSGHRIRLASLLAVDLRDAARAAYRFRWGSARPAPVGRLYEPRGISEWLRSIEVAPAHTLGAGRRPSGTHRAVAAWVDGVGASDDEVFDAVVMAAITRRCLPIVELRGELRMHVLVPVCSDDDHRLDSALYCVDLVRGRGGHLGRLGDWTWDERPAPSVTPSDAMTVRPAAGTSP